MNSKTGCRLDNFFLDMYFDRELTRETDRNGREREQARNAGLNTPLHERMDGQLDSWMGGWINEGMHTYPLPSHYAAAAPVKPPPRTRHRSLGVGNHKITT